MQSDSFSSADKRAIDPYHPQLAAHLSTRPYVLWAVVGFVVWCAGAAWFSAQYSRLRAERGMAQAVTHVAQDVDAIATGLQRNLQVFHGIPAAIGRDVAVAKLLQRFAGDGGAQLTAGQRRQSLEGDQELATLNQSLAQSSRDIGALSVIWVINPTGLTIAASNAARGDSFVGTNYADRAYFKAAMEGRMGHQYALGRVTNVPGLFFSAPVKGADGRTIGVVAGKVDLAFLAYWVNQANAYLADDYGVIVLAKDKKLEMLAVPGAAVGALSEIERFLRYKRKEFTTLQLSAWGAPGFASLQRLDAGALPTHMASRPIPDDGLTVTVMEEVPAVGAQWRDTLQWFAALATLGAALTVGLAAGLFHFKSLANSRRFRDHQEHISYLATHDSLTGLFSRTVLEPLVTQGIAVARRTERVLGLLYVDLDLFKEINDQLGHEVGDQVLRCVAERMRDVVRSADAVIRLGGDEFVVLVNDMESRQHAAHIARKLLEALHRPCTIAGAQVQLSASIGIAHFPGDGDNAAELLRNADAALYRAKDAGRNNYQVFAPPL